MFDNGRLKAASFNTDQGFGLRAVAGEAVGYAHAGDLSEAALKRAADAVSAVTRGYSGTLADSARRAPTGSSMATRTRSARPSFEAKAKLLQEIDAYLRAKDPRVRQVTASLAAIWQQVDILRADGQLRARHPADDAPQRLRRRRRRRPAGNRLLRRRRPQGFRRFPRRGQLEARAPTRRCARRWSISRPSRRRPAPSTSCSPPAGRASCCMRRSATGWKAISTARRPRPSPACSASRSRPRA